MNIHDFFQKSVDGLVKYILVHYDRDYWFENWVGVSDIRKYYETTGGSIGNPYFSFNWTEAAYRHMAINMTVMVDGKHLDIEETFAYFSEHKYPIPDEYLTRSLKISGWSAFCKGVHPKTDPIKDEALACLTAIAGDTDMADQLDHLLWTLKVMHAGGKNTSIAVDYGGLGFLDVDFVRCNGIAAMFGRDDVEKFLRGEYPPLKIDLRTIRLALARL